jgi:hypothetical protein
VSHVRYVLDFYIPEDDILHSHRRENLKSYITNLCFLNDAAGSEMCYLVRVKTSLELL